MKESFYVIYDNKDIVQIVEKWICAIKYKPHSIFSFSEKGEFIRKYEFSNETGNYNVCLDF